MCSVCDEEARRDREASRENTLLRQLQKYSLQISQGYTPNPPEVTQGVDLRTVVGDEDITYSYFTGIDFTGAIFDGLVMTGSRLGRILTGASFKGASLGSATITGDADNANFEGARLGGAFISSASFRGASFRGADLHRAMFEDCDLAGADFTGCTGLVPPQLRNCRNVRSAIGTTACQRCTVHYTIGQHCHTCLQQQRQCVTCAKTGWGPWLETRSGYICDNSKCDEGFEECDECATLCRYSEMLGGRCHQCRRRDGRVIRDYSDRTANRLGPFGPGPVWFGVEVEVEVDEDDDVNATAIEVQRRIGKDFAVLKHDGSINNGFEIVTARADVATHAERWKQALRPRLQGVSSFNTDTCGMHVHISRAPLSSLTIGKMLVFLNEPGNSALVHGIAGRSANDYCRVSKKKVQDVNLRRDRYDALNLTNEHTIEVRIFRGTILYEGVMRNIEFCHALVDFCSNTGLNQLDAGDFLKHVARTPRVWPHLTHWLRRKDFLVAPSVKPGARRPPLHQDI